MAINNRIAWEEGMFLAPQHFQQHDRFIENLINQKTTRIEPLMWGLTTIQIDNELLALGKFAVTECEGIFPDGTVFSIPNEEQAPLPLALPENTSSKHIYLGLPLRRSGIADYSLQKSDAQSRFCIHNKEIADVVAGIEQTVDVPLATLRLQYLLEGQDRSGFTCVPLALVKEVRSDNKILLDNRFIPACITVNAIPQLGKITREIQALLRHRAQTLSHRLTDSQQAETAVAIDFMLLQLINRYEPLFNHLAQQIALHPELLYRYLIQLTGEIATYTCDDRRASIPPIYNHNDLLNTYDPILSELRKSLSMVLEQNAVLIALEQQKQGVWLAVIEDKALLKNTQFILAVYADLPPDTIRFQFARQTKLAPVEQLRHLISHQLPGIELQPMPIAPRQIPYHANYTYFNLNQQHESWQYLERSAALAIHCSGNMPNLKLELWSIKG